MVGGNQRGHLVEWTSELPVWRKVSPLQEIMYRAA